MGAAQRSPDTAWGGVSREGFLEEVVPQQSLGGCWRSCLGSQELGEDLSGPVGSMGGHRDACGGGAGVLEEGQAVRCGVGVEGDQSRLVGRGLTLTMKNPYATTAEWVAVQWL